MQFFFYLGWFLDRPPPFHHTAVQTTKASCLTDYTVGKRAVRGEDGWGADDNGDTSL